MKVIEKRIRAAKSHIDSAQFGLTTPRRGFRYPQGRNTLLIAVDQNVYINASVANERNRKGQTQAR